MLTSIKENEVLIKRLSESAGKPTSKENRERQIVSFIYGNLPKDSGITRERVEERIRTIEGI